MSSAVVKPTVFGDLIVLSQILCEHLKLLNPKAVGGSFCAKMRVQSLNESASQCEMCSVILNALVRDVPEVLKEEEMPVDFMVCRREEIRSGRNKTLRKPMGVCVLLPERHIVALCPALSPVGWRLIWQNSNVNRFERPLAVICNWMNECKTNHTLCASKWNKQTVLPTRLIDVGVEGDLVKLVENDIAMPSDTSDHYAALSYSWGQVNVLKTQKNNHIEFLSEIPFGRVPTIQDAIILCRKLKLRYLWVDSFCIIQDDRSDWEREAVKMASIYQNAFITLVATSSKAAGEGLWVAPDGETIQSTFLPPGAENPMEAVHIRAPPRTCFRPVGHDWSQEPTSRRAWIFQETILSHRALHFMTDQVLWQCNTHVTSEDGLWAGSLLNQNRYPQGDYMEIWESWVELYSSCSITKPEDRFAALAGAVDYFKNRSGYTFCAGLWVENLPFELLWYEGAPGGKQPPSSWAKVPSWSWMKSANSINCHPVVWAKRDVAENEVVALAEYVEMDIIWSGRPLLSLPMSGSLHLRARMLTVSMHYRLGWKIILTTEHVNFPRTLEDPRLAYASWDNKSTLTIDEKWCVYTHQFHYGFEGKPNDGEVWLLVAAHHGQRSSRSAIISMFLWVEKAEKPNNFRRRGMGEVQTNFDFFQMSEMLDVTLV